MKPVIAIVGRPNVGKSTLFNRICGGRAAIVEDTPGVTRDRLYRDATWLGRDFTLIDTGGLEFKEEDSLTGQVKKQVEVALEEADVIILVVDGKLGIIPDDYAVAERLRKTKKPVILAVNKVERFDNPAFMEFYQLGLGEPIPVSAMHGMNVGDLLDRVTEAMPDLPADDYEPDVIKIAVVGRPNVGKSSLVNIFLGRERVIVSDMPGTTRDAIDTVFRRNGRQYVVIDTAGLRRKSRVENPTERYSVIRSLRAIDRSDVVLMILDAVQGVTEQDKRIAGYAHEAGKATVLVVNKWDMVDKDATTINRFEAEIRRELAFLHYAPTAFTSALTKKRVYQVLDLVDFVAEQAARRVTTSVLNDVLAEATRLTPPPAEKGKRLKIFYATQAGVKPPKFILFVNEPKLLHFSYKRYLEKQLRQAFGFEGNPVWLLIRKREK